MSQDFRFDANILEMLDSDIKCDLLDLVRREDLNRIPACLTPGQA